MNETDNMTEWRETLTTRKDTLVQNLIEMAGSAFALLAMFALAWLFAVVTPPQKSAICDLDLSDSANFRCSFTNNLEICDALIYSGGSK